MALCPLFSKFVENKMFRYLLSLGLGYFVFTENGRKMAKEFLEKASPLAEEYIANPIIKTIKEKK